MSQTLKQMADRIDRDLSLNIDDPTGQSLVIREDVNNYLNEGHEYIAREISTKIKEDYFLRLTQQPIIAGIGEYNLPHEMFINKIRGVLFGNDSGYTKLQEASFEEYLNYSSQQKQTEIIPCQYFLSQPGKMKMISH